MLKGELIKRLFALYTVCLLYTSADGDILFSESVSLILDLSLIHI